MSKVIPAVFYILKYFCLNIVCPIIPHPKLRAFYLKFLGAKIGKNVRIENIKFIQIQCSVKNFRCGDNVFIGTGVIIDLSSTISIGSNSMVGVGCIFLTHQDFGEFFDSKLSKIYPKEYSPITIMEDVVVACDSTLLPGTTIEIFTVVGAKSLVRGNLSGNAFAAGVPAKVVKRLLE
ncbi:MAG: acyltransferase [Deltaproteobacteria bacterium]|nr:acyltransferase [Deltaproteobacteria bacterium]